MSVNKGVLKKSSQFKNKDIRRENWTEITWDILVFVWQ